MIFKIDLHVCNKTKTYIPFFPSNSNQTNNDSVPTTTLVSQFISTLRSCMFQF